MNVCRSIENMVINPTGRKQAVIVSTLPAAGAENYIYLVPDGDMYSAYKYEDGEWVSVSGGSCDAVIVDALPEVGEVGKIYLLNKLLKGTADGGTDVEGCEWHWDLYEDYVVTSSLPQASNNGLTATFVVNGNIYQFVGGNWNMLSEHATVLEFNEQVNPCDHIGEFCIFTNYSTGVIPIKWDGTGYTTNFIVLPTT